MKVLSLPTMGVLCLQARAEQPLSSVEVGGNPSSCAA